VNRDGELDAVWRRESERARSEGLERTLPEAPAGLDFTSNDSLGLSRHPGVIAAARAALERYGAGGRASRLLGGGCPLDLEAERACAEWLQGEAALLFASGYHANVGLVTALAERGDLILSDELNHASLIDAARLSRARIEVFPHAQPDAVERALARGGYRRAWVVTESLFSMDGDRAPLQELAEVCQRREAWLIVDEAHATGLLGPEGRGGAALAHIAGHPRLVARVVTGGKALGVQGAFVVGSTALRQHLVQRARTLAFTTAPSPAVAGGLCAAISLARLAKGARQRVLAHAHLLADALGLDLPGGAIVPVLVGEASAALAAASALNEQGFLVRAVRPPTVPQGTSRLRVVLHAQHEEDQVLRLARALLAAGLPRRERADAARPQRAARVLFVAGTDTGVGKTVVAAALSRAAARAGAAGYWKPVQTGSEDDAGTVRELASAAELELVPNVYRFALPASPHAAAAAEGAEIDPERLHQTLAALRAERKLERLVVELAGGLLVPLHRDFTQVDWLQRERADLVLVARSGLGTINHTSLSYEALRRRGLEPRALFLVGPPHPSNRATLEHLLAPRCIVELPQLDELSAGPLDQALAGHDLCNVFPA
jgi:8-amino-7-oxononanoate synthase